MVARTIPHCAVTPKHVNKFSLTTNTALILKQSTIIFKKDLQTDFVVCNPCILRYIFLFLMVITLNLDLESSLIVTHWQSRTVFGTNRIHGDREWALLTVQPGC